MFRFFFISILLTAACTTDKTTEKDKEIPQKQITSKGIEVTATTIPQIQFNKQLVANGLIEAVEKTDMRFKTGNRLASIRAKNGMRVKKGQIIAHLENSLLKNRLEKAKIELDKARVKLEETIINYNFGNADTKKIAPEVLQNLKLKSGVLDAQNSYENAKIQYDQTLLTAPFSGVVANIKTKPGDFITASDVFCTLINPEKLQVRFAILESEMEFIKPKQQVEVSTFNSENRYNGYITEINPAVNKNGLIEIKAQLLKPNNRLLDGMHVNVLINQPVPDVLVIPKQAVVLRSNRKVVFSVHNGLARWNYITDLYENNAYIAVKKGENLKATDTIIVSGNLNLAHDAKINVRFIPNQKP